HQLRGRVGRYKHRAYAYMLLPNSRPISPVAAKRLKAIEEYSHLGAGFRIALRDLEIRGAGNILGPEQSGHIQMVGYQMYCELLANAVHEMRNETVEPMPTTTIDLGFAVSIPKNYIALDRQRMDVYRKIAVARTVADVRQIEAELSDVYGPLPDDVTRLLEIAELRIAAAKWDIQSIAAQAPPSRFAPPSTKRNLIFSFKQDPGDKANALFASIKAEIRIPDPKTIYLNLPPNYFEPPTLITILRRTFAEKKND
ncbi:MAG: hypothetical protein JW741_27320, partial [Sedimentisphaerales bacterium]|nr:hypothetical protein [Sedimentisphaerales bacterium]